MPFRLGPMELVIILVVVLLIFGARKVPQLGRNLGEGLRQFKRGVSGEEEQGDRQPSRG